MFNFPLLVAMIISLPLRSVVARIPPAEIRMSAVVVAASSLGSILVVTAIYLAMGLLGEKPLPALARRLRIARTTASGVVLGCFAFHVFGLRWSACAREIAGESIPLAGTLLAPSVLRAFISIAPSEVPEYISLTLDSRAMLLVLGVLVLTALLAGTMPAVLGARVDPAGALRGRGDTTGRRGLAHPPPGC